MMSTIERDREHNGELVVITKGAPDVLLEHCTRARIGMEVVDLDHEVRSRALSAVARLTDEALRTLAVAYRPLAPGECAGGLHDLERDLIFVGTVGIIDPPRPEAAVAIHEAKRAGIRVIMITGDHPRTAARIARRPRHHHPKRAKALTGAELDETRRFRPRGSGARNRVYARVAPVHELRIVDALQGDGNIVAMTGDGVNDAPALKSADIGIAMGVAGAEVTKQAAKIILADDNFATIVEAVREGRSIFDNIRARCCATCCRLIWARC
jgi:Ca2+-transporting ATPase